MKMDGSKNDGLLTFFPAGSNVSLLPRSSLSSSWIIVLDFSPTLFIEIADSTQIHRDYRSSCVTYNVPLSVRCREDCT